MAAIDILLSILGRFGDIITAPAQNFDMLWILIFIYLNWILTDYFQERKGTDFGNAFVNGFTGLWVGVDWIRQLTKAEAAFDASFAAKTAICIFFIIYGMIIMIEAARAKKIAHYVGRIREVSYLMIVLTPIFYGVVAIDFITFGAILLFFPIFYGLGELIDRILPAPKTEEAEFGAAPDLGAPLETPSFGAGPELPSAGGLPGFPPAGPGGGLPPFK